MKKTTILAVTAILAFGTGLVLACTGHDGYGASYTGIGYFGNSKKEVSAMGDTGPFLAGEIGFDVIVFEVLGYEDGKGKGKMDPIPSCPTDVIRHDFSGYTSFGDLFHGTGDVEVVYEGKGKDRTLTGDLLVTVHSITVTVDGIAFHDDGGFSFELER